MLFNILYKILETVINISSIALIFCSLFWLLYLISEIRRIYPLWKYQLKVCSNEGEDRAKYYKNILIKNTLGFLFVVSEITTFSAETVEGAVHLFVLYLWSPGTGAIGPICPLRSKSYLWWNSEVPLVRILETIRQIGMLFLPTTLTLVVLHLQSVYTGYNRIALMRRHVVLTCLCAVVFVIAKCFMLSILLSELLYLTLLPILFFQLIQQTRYLYASMTCRLIDIWHEGESYKAMYLREKRMLTLFKWTIIPIYISAVIGVFGQIFDGIVHTFIGSLVFNSCWVNSEFGIPLNISFSNATVETTEKLVEVSKFVFLATGNVFIGSVVVVNLGIYLTVLLEKFRGRPFSKTSLRTLLVSNVN